MKTGGKVFFLALIILASVGGYYKWYTSHPHPSSAGTDQTASGATQQTTEVPQSTSILKIAGSNTIGDVLAPALCKGWMESTGYSNVQILNTGKDEKAVVGTKNGKTERIDIAAHGTSTGFTSLSGNSADICMASSKDNSGSYAEHVIGLDGIAIIASSSSPINSLSMADIQNTFSGSSSKIYRMDDNSGTYKVFKEVAMAGRDINSSAKQFASATELVNAVAADGTGIGFASYTFVNTSGIKAIPISIAAGMPPIIPNPLTIQSEKYPLCRRLYMYTPKNGNQLPDGFIKYVESPAGQMVVQNNGFINLSINVNNNNDNPIAMPNDPPAYTALINSSKKISTEFRFEFGSLTLDSRAMADITRVVSFLSQPENRGKKLILVGFTDNVGDPGKNVQLSLQRASAVKGVLEGVGASVQKVMGFGPARPVRGNTTDEDRANNRRVEIWLTN